MPAALTASGAKTHSSDTEAMEIRRIEQRVRRELQQQQRCATDEPPSTSASKKKQSEQRGVLTNEEILLRFLRDAVFYFLMDRGRERERNRTMCTLPLLRTM